MRIYVAGKFYGTAAKHYDRDWRNDLVGNEDAMDWGVSDQSSLSAQWRKRSDAIRGLARGGHDYIGPFKSDCGGHGEGQGPTDHGSWASRDEYEWVEGHEPNEMRRQSVLDACLDAICQADLFYAWVDRFDAFGTLAEIGYAAGIRDTRKDGRPYVAVAYPRTISASGELWFSLRLANLSDYAGDPVQGYDKAIYWATTAFRNLRPPRRAIPRSLRWVILEKFNYTCQYCGRRRHSSRHDPDGNTWHVDHMVSLASGGVDGPENLTLACQACNLRKGSRRVSEWRCGSTWTC